MKISHTTLAILAFSFLAQTASAKMGQNRTNVTDKTQVEINVIEQINDNINDMLAQVKKPEIKIEVAKQLSIDSLQLQTAEETSPTFKFKVVIAD